MTASHVEMVRSLVRDSIKDAFCESWKSLTKSGIMAEHQKLVLANGSVEPASMGEMVFVIIQLHRQKSNLSRCRG